MMRPPTREDAAAQRVDAAEGRAPFDPVVHVLEALRVLLTEAERARLREGHGLAPYRLRAAVALAESAATTVTRWREPDAVVHAHEALRLLLSDDERERVQAGANPPPARMEQAAQLAMEVACAVYASRARRRR